MEDFVLNSEVQEFLDDNLDGNIPELLFRGSPFKSIGIQVLVEQIEAKVRCKHKLPTWFNTSCIYYPNKLNIEQTSSEITAKFKSQLIEGDSIVDLTGGFGVDCYYFSKRFSTVIHCEINQKLSEIVRHNFQQLQVQNIKTVSEDGLSYIGKAKETYDWIYVDPSRRHESKGKVFRLRDCEPNLPEHLEYLFEYSSNILIKTSPMLDFTIGINELKNVKSIVVVAVNNEVKELLWILKKNYNGEITIQTVNHTKQESQHFDFILDEETKVTPIYDKPLRYLYEPNAAILKSGAFNSVSEALKVNKLQKHSHLYTSEQILEFPGRRFVIEKVLEYNKKTLKKEGIKKANITTRNFPETVNTLRKKFNIRDGGLTYLFFTTDLNEQKLVLVCRKV